MVKSSESVRCVQSVNERFVKSPAALRPVKSNVKCNTCKL